VVASDLAAASEIEVKAFFFHAGRAVGTARRSLFVGQDASASAAAATGRLEVEADAEPPDLTVTVLVPDASRPGDLLWLVEAREHFNGLPESIRGKTNVGPDARSYASKLLDDLSSLVRGQHVERFQGVGDEIWRRAPGVFHDTYWAMWDHYRRPLSIQFISDEPNVPWELMRPSRPGEQHALLVMGHAVARWITDYGNNMQNHLPEGGLAVLAPRYRSPSRRLKAAQEEAESIITRFGAARLEATRAKVIELLEGADPRIGFLHFAGHGHFDMQTPNSSAIELEDAGLAAGEVARQEVTLGEVCRTLVFFNACEVGASSSALGAVGGWAEALLRRRFGGFIAPLWAVDDEDSSTVANELLDRIVKEKQPIGAVLRGIRERHGAESPTFLSYLYYGDVNARFL
jgi:hypothetical protein